MSVTQNCWLSVRRKIYCITSSPFIVPTAPLCRIPLPGSVQSAHFMSDYHLSRWLLSVRTCVSCAHHHISSSAVNGLFCVHDLLLLELLTCFDFE